MYKTAFGKAAEKDVERWTQASKQWCLKFLRSPMEFLPNSDNSRVDAIRLGINKLEVINTQ